MCQYCKIIWSPSGTNKQRPTETMALDLNVSTFLCFMTRFLFIHFFNFAFMQFSDTLTHRQVRQRISSICASCMTGRIRNIRICKLSDDRLAPLFYHVTEIAILKGEKISRRFVRKTPNNLIKSKVN